MKICFVVHTFDKRDRGGVLRVVSQLANLLCEDYIVEILSVGKIYENSYDLSPRISLISLEMERYNTGYYVGVSKLKWFKETYVKIKPFLNQKTIWITSSPPISLLFSLIKIKNKKINVIGCDHTTTIYQKGIIVQKIRNFMLKKLDVMVALTPQDKEYYESMGIKSVCIPNGIDLNTIKQRENDRKYIVFVGRFNEEKQPFKAIELFIDSQIYKHGLKLRMFGHGDYEQEIVEYIKLKNLEDYVEIIIGEKDPNKIYEHAYALLMTSKIEGFGLVLLEAIARNIPCISFDCPYGPRNIIRNGVNGFLINESSQELKNSIQLLKNIPENMRDSIDKFNLSSISNNWIKLIKE